MRADETRYAVPGWGVGDLWTCGGVVLAHDFRFVAAKDRDAFMRTSGASSAGPPEGAQGPPLGTVTTNSRRRENDFVSNRRQEEGAAWTQELVARLTAFLSGDDAPLDDVDLDLTWATPFQRAVAGALRGVPRGETVTYGELAALAGHPGAQRAVGSFCSRNRFMLLVPCHRVTAADGIGGYGDTGTEIKRRLLELEGVFG